MDYLDFSEQNEDTNHEYLLLFQEDLENAGLKQKNIYNHLSNADLSINDFSGNRMNVTMEEGVTMLGDFLGDYFIRKCMWSSPSTVKTTTASLKKFYKSMAKHRKIEKKDYDYVCRDIKESMEYWQESCKSYNNPHFPF
ncbi:hypothetical protein [Catenibacterium sp.]|uniref:hypothetical protein n=1 Tax=Catenibacterium sp. TaxID=2049022 RepID=UPI002E767EB3|nr:hypothetical protein [Catenibacterium sp.]MEE0491960.1 hypothetical protein [Catenibacterium sp.]